MGVVEALAGLVREMNCYYSNLIEGHVTHPVDIERALKADYSTDPEQRNLQLEPGRSPHAGAMAVTMRPSGCFRSYETKRRG